MAARCTRVSRSVPAKSSIAAKTPVGTTVACEVEYLVVPYSAAGILAMIHLLVTHGGGPGVSLMQAASLFGGVAFVLLIVVMRSLLVVATADRAELEQLI